MTNITRIKWKYLLIVFAFILASVLMRVFYDKHQHDQHFDTKVMQLSQDAHQYYQDLIVGLKDKYLTLTNHYANEVAVKGLLASKSTQLLYQYVLADYRYLQQNEPNLHIMHFIDNHNQTILRMHQPENYGDDLTLIRPIVRDVNAHKKALQGFEVGKNGITYRITTPLIDQNKQHIGLLEFGIKPSYFVERLNQRFSIESAILVKTDSLGVLLEPGGFPALNSNGFSLIHSTPIFDKLLTSVDLNKETQLIELDGRIYLVLTNLNQPNHHGVVVSKVLIAKDVTGFRVEIRSALLQDNAINLSVLFFLWVAIYIMFSRYGQKLSQSHQIIQALNQQTSHFKNQANSDTLTGLYNRRFFNQAIEHIISYDKVGSLLFFDIDHFKKINDQYGHAAGDLVLTEFARMLESFFRQDDLLVRWGGEEFAVFLQDMSEEDAVKKAERFRQFVEVSGDKHQSAAFTVSGGVVQLVAGDSLESLFQRADACLYAAKQTGRNRVVAAKSLMSVNPLR